MEQAEKKSSDIAKLYTPTQREREALKASGTRWAGAKLAPRVKVTDIAGASQIGVDHPDRVVGQMLLMDALGTVDIDFFDGLLRQLANAASQGKKVDESALNFMLSMVQGIKPTDQVEVMLAAQMAAVHNAMMTFARRLNYVENIPQQDSAERAFNKLARTFAAQVEALKRYRTGGEQRVIVQHVTVCDGGQAVVGAVNHAGGSEK